MREVKRGRATRCVTFMGMLLHDGAVEVAHSPTGTANKPPDSQRSKKDPGSGVAVRFTEVVRSNRCTHCAALHCMFPEIVTTPVPVPTRATVRTGRLNLAVTSRSRSIVTVHVVLVPEQPPPTHSTNIPVPWVAVSSTLWL